MRGGGRGAWVLKVSPTMHGVLGAGCWPLGGRRAACRALACEGWTKITFAGLFVMGIGCEELDGGCRGCPLTAPGARCCALGSTWSLVRRCWGLGGIWRMVTVGGKTVASGGLPEVFCAWWWLVGWRIVWFALGSCMATGGGITGWATQRTSTQRTCNNA